MVTLNPIFASGMVMQAGKATRVFGTGEGTVSVEFLGQTKSTVAKLPPCFLRNYFKRYRRILLLNVFENLQHSLAIFL